MSAMTTQQPDFYHPDHVNRTRPLGRLLSFVLFLAAFLAIGYVFYFFMSRGASRFSSGRVPSTTPTPRTSSF